VALGPLHGPFDRPLRLALRHAYRNANTSSQLHPFRNSRSRVAFKRSARLVKEAFGLLQILRMIERLRPAQRATGPGRRVLRVIERRGESARAGVRVPDREEQGGERPQAASPKKTPPVPVLLARGSCRVGARLPVVRAQRGMSCGVRSNSSWRARNDPPDGRLVPVVQHDDLHRLGRSLGGEQHGAETATKSAVALHRRYHDPRYPAWPRASAAW